MDYVYIAKIDILLFKSAICHNLIMFKMAVTACKPSNLSVFLSCIYDKTAIRVLKSTLVVFL